MIGLTIRKIWVLILAVSSLDWMRGFALATAMHLTSKQETEEQTLMARQAIISDRGSRSFTMFNVFIGSLKWANASASKALSLLEAALEHHALIETGTQI